MIDLWPVKSGRVARWGWEGEPGERDRGMLVLEYRDGSVYVYRGVGERVLANFLMADSKGKCVDRWIAAGWKGEKVTEGLDWRFRRG